MNVASTLAATAGIAAAERIADTVSKKWNGKKGPAKKKQKTGNALNGLARPKVKNLGFANPKRFKGKDVPTKIRVNRKALATEFNQRASKRKVINKFGGSSTVDVVNVTGRLVMTPIYSLDNQNERYERAFEISLNPLAFPNSKLYNLATQYTRFKFKKITLNYIPFASTTVDGCMAMYAIKDPELRLNGQEGSFPYFQAMMQMPDTTTFSVWEECSKTFVFSETDGSSYFIAPDVQGEARFTTQGVIGLLSMFNFTTNYVYGYVSLDYEIDLWESCEQALSFSNSVVLAAWNTTAANTAPFNDTVGANTYITFNTNGTTESNYSGLSAGTVYSVFFTFNLGGAKAWTTYYVMTPNPLTGTSAAPLYKTAADASGSTGENFVPGSYVWKSLPPSNGSIFMTQIQGAEESFGPVNKNLTRVASQDGVDLTRNLQNLTMSELNVVNRLTKDGFLKVSAQ